MKKCMFLVCLLLVTLLSGCVEFAWNSAGHLKTQIPTLKTDKVAFEQEPIPSQEVVNYNKPNEKKDYQFASFHGKD